MDIRELLACAEKEKATHIHLTVGAKPMLRKNGDLSALEDYAKISPKEIDEIADHLLSDAKKEELNKTGSVNVPVSIPGVGRYRLTVFMQRGTVAVTIKLLHTDIASAEDLYIPENITELSMRKKGIIVVAGPACSGRSTTIASILKQINERRSLSIMTAENPIEYLFRHGKSIIVQKEIGSDVADYVQALKAARTEDHDVVMVGRLSGYEEVQLAMELAESGKLIITSMHTSNVYDTINRMVSVFPLERQPQAKAQIARTLNTVVSQQLIPMEGGAAMVPAFELMHLNQSIRSSLINGDFSNVENRILEKSKTSFRMDTYILELYKAGVISSENAVRYAKDGREMQEWIHSVQ